MTTFEHLRMIDLVEKFRAEIDNIYASKNLSGLTGASGLLQSIYNFHLTADESFIRVEEYLKNLYSSFNYAALICNDAVKKKGLTNEDKTLLAECFQIMLKCCGIIISELNK